MNSIVYIIEKNEKIPNPIKFFFDLKDLSLMMVEIDHLEN
jgi:hypothetical protein